MHAIQLVQPVQVHPPLVGLPLMGQGFESWFAPAWDVPSFPIKRAPAVRKYARVVTTLRSKEKGEPAVPLLKIISVRQSLPPGTGRADGLGIDLKVRGLEVRKLFYAAFARGLVKDGYDPEEALQEVYRGLLARNLGKCPFDAKKSSFGHYVHIVTRCVLANYIRKEKRRTHYESSESQLYSPGSERGFSIQDAPDLRTGVQIEPGTLDELSRSISVSTQSNPVTVQEALRLLADGHPRRKVCSTLQVESRWLDLVLAEARSHLVG